MLRLRRSFFFAMVLALVGAQSWHPAEPRPSKPRYSSGSYSSFPGRIPKPPPINDPEFSPPGNGPSNVPQDTKSFSAVKANSGTVVIPGSSSSYSAFPGQFSPPETAVVSESFSAVQQKTVPEPMPVQPNIYSSTETRGAQGGSFSAIAASELSQGIKKPNPPKSTGTDSWTPMGHLGTGQPWNPMSASGTQQLPYDTTQSSLTLGEQIMQKQLQQKQQLPQQQQQQQYNVFGLPLNNAQDPFTNLFGMTPAMDLFAPLSVPQDPFFGMFGGASTGMGSTAGNGQGGNFLQMMLLMQLLGGGADAPDPQPPTVRGGGPGVGPSLTPASALEQLIRLEEMRSMRNRQGERVNRNRALPRNQRHGPYQRNVQERQHSRHATASSSFDTTNTLSGPAPARLPSSSSRRQKFPPNRPAAAARASFHPEVLDRRNMPTTPAPTLQGQEPIEREGPGAQGQTSNQGQNVAPTGTPPREFERQRPRSYNAEHPHSARQGNTFRYQSYNTFQHPAWSNQQHNYQASRGQNFGQGSQGRRGVPRNIQQLVNDPLFQRRLRVAGSSPGANPADVRADQADLMADRADNMQAMGPLNMMLNSGMYGGMGMSGFGGLQSGSGLSPLASLFGSGGGTGGLSSLGMLRGGMGF